MVRRFRPNSNVSAATLTGFKMEIRFSDTASFASFNFRLISLWEGRSMYIMVSIDTFCQQNNLNRKKTANFEVKGGRKSRIWTKAR